MEWITEVQRTLGAPVVAFAQENWVFFLVVGGLAVLWLFSSAARSGGVSVGVGIGGDNASGDGDGGGGDGGGD